MHIYTLAACRLPIIRCQTLFIGLLIWAPCSIATVGPAFATPDRPGEHHHVASPAKHHQQPRPRRTRTERLVRLLPLLPLGLGVAAIFGPELTVSARTALFATGEPTPAFAFDATYREKGRAPIPPSDLQRVTQMTPDLWRTDDLIAHFRRHATAEQRAIAVVIKTEYCCGNAHRPCAITTAVMEKGQPQLKPYIAWIKHADATLADPTARDKKAAWDKQLIDAYDFRQGPGATIVLIDPKTGRRLRTDAAEMKLTRWHFDVSRGQTPTLDAVVKRFIRGDGA